MPVSRSPRRACLRPSYGADRLATCACRSRRGSAERCRAVAEALHRAPSPICVQTRRRGHRARALVAMFSRERARRRHPRHRGRCCPPAPRCRAGVEEISIMATHGTFSGDRWRELPAAAPTHLVTDSVPDVRRRAGSVVEVVSIAPLLMDALAISHQSAHDRARSARARRAYRSPSSAGYGCGVPPPFGR